MRFRYRDGRGKVVRLPDVASLLEAIRGGAVTSDTELAVGDGREWHRAETVTAYQQAVAGLGKLSGPLHQAPSAAPPDLTPWHARRAVRIGAAITTTALALLLAAGRIWYLGREAEAARKRAMVTAPSPGLRAQAHLRVLSFQYGDSVAVEQRQLQEWLAKQGFDGRVRGAALKNPALLRAARAAGAGYRLRVDSLVARSAELARRLVARADSLESSANGFDGLATALEDDLANWERDFAEYAEVERGVAAAIDSLTAFVLEKQASFVIRDGAPVFLTHADAARFMELAEHLRALPNHERAWSERLLSRRPDWMESLAEEDRPRFGRAVLATP